MTSRYKWWVVGMLWWIAFFNYADRQAIFSVFPLLEKELGLSSVQLGLLGSAFAWVYGLGSPVAHPRIIDSLLDSPGRKVPPATADKTSNSSSVVQ